MDVVYYLVDVSYDEKRHGFTARKWTFKDNGIIHPHWSGPGGLFSEPGYFEIIKQLPNGLRSLK